MTRHVHVLTVTSNIPPLFRALCGFQSDDRKDYRKEKQSIDVVTCEECIRQMGRLEKPVETWRVK